MTRIGLALGLALLALVLLVATAAADPYFNSSEPGCDGSDPNVLLCDDFETSGVANSPNGKWYGENIDVANANGGIDVRTKGWGGTIFAEPITPAGAVSCGGAGAASDCAGDSGVLTGARGGRNMADHGFAPNRSKHNELYFRYYFKTSVGTDWSEEKMLTINQDVGSGGIIITSFTVRPTGTGAEPQVVACPTVSPPCYVGSNLGNPLFMQGGRWYYIEHRIVLNTPGVANGTWELWSNDCGTSGICTGSPTKRASYIGTFGWRASGNNAQMGVMWIENWGNNRPSSPCFGQLDCQSDGTIGRHWYDNVKVATVGPIGFAGAGTPPPSAPTNLCGCVGVGCVPPC